MRKLLSLTIGFGFGAAIGVMLVMLFAPTSGAQLAENLKRGFQESLESARQASEQRRAELEAELAEMQKR